MHQFLETICIKDGIPLHLDWHQRRVDATLHYFYPNESIDNLSFQLEEILASCAIPGNDVYRCRIVYGLNALSVEFYPYPTLSIQTLRLVEAPKGYDYRYKLADRKVLDELFAQRGDADDILITRDGWVTDTAIANIAFRKKDRWYTPSFPLLAGTTWKRLVSTRQLIPRPIHQKDIMHFDAFRVFNAMNDWDVKEVTPTTKILFSID